MIKILVTLFNAQKITLEFENSYLDDVIENLDGKRCLSECKNCFTKGIYKVNGELGITTCRKGFCYNAVESYKIMKDNKIGGNMELKTCEHCNKEVDSIFFDAIDDNGDDITICEDCKDNEFYECYECGFLHHKDDKHVAQNANGMNVIVCSKCLNERYFQCEHCENYHHNDVLITARNDANRDIFICQGCYDSDFATCRCCDNVYHLDNMNTADDESVCERCLDRYYFYCEHCEQYHNNDYPCECESESPDKIHNYSYKPNALFTGVSSKHNPFIGFELEIECSTDSGKLTDAAEIASELSNVYLKEDGSIHHGFEIVSHPSTLEEHKKMDYENIFKKLVKNGSKSHDTKTCGLHFHLENKWLTDKAKIRLGMFFHHHQAKIEIIARRKESTYAKYKKENNEYGISRERYEAVNFQPRNTVEFRVFKGTLKYESFMGCMEFSHAVYSYVQTKGVTVNSILKWNKFLKFIKDNKNLYPYLTQYMIDLDVLQEDIELIYVEGYKEIVIDDCFVYEKNGDVLLCGILYKDLDDGDDRPIDFPTNCPIDSPMINLSSAIECVTFLDDNPSMVNSFYRQYPTIASTSVNIRR